GPARRALAGPFQPDPAGDRRRLQPESADRRARPRRGLRDHPPRPLRDRGRAAHHGGDVPRHGLAARVVTSRPLPLWLAGAVVAGTFALLLWLEGRQPLRRTVEPKTWRLARNLAVAALSTAAVALTERPAIGALSRLVASRRWGLLQWRALPPARAAPPPLAPMSSPLYLW